MRKILIPTDLTSQSLKIAEEAFKIYPNEIVNILLVYPYRLPLWNIEMYWYSPVRVITEHTDEHFSSAKDELVNKYYKNINSIRVELFTGINSIAFDNFRTHHRIQTAVVPQKGFLGFSHKATFNPIDLILKTVPKVHQVQINKGEHPAQNTEKEKSGISSFIKRALQF